MSTFEGKLLEDSLDFIRIDQFEPKNHDGTYFFLSHFHTDHFKGLFTEEFLKVLSENEEKKLYCTNLTKSFISNYRFQSSQIPEHKVCPLTSGEPLVLEHKGQKVQVTPIPAGHCPGSVMFLFELEERNQDKRQGTTRVLYTGDFRINPNELHKFKALHYRDGTVKKINRLYLDTTFCSPKWISFPSRKQTEKDLIRVMRDWLESDHNVGIRYNAYHGLEYLLIKIASSLQTRIDVRDLNSYVNYCCIPELQPLLTRAEDPSKMNSRIHLCGVRRDQERCEVCSQDRATFKTIKPCAMSFDNEQLDLGREKEGVDGLVKIAYSLHCSLEELIGTVNYLKPDDVYPCALPHNVSQEEVLKNLQLDVEKLKLERKEMKKKTEASSSSSSPPSKKFCFSLIPQEENKEQVDEEEKEESTVLDKRLSSLVCLNTDDEEEIKPLSLSPIDSPPL